MPVNTKVNSPVGEQKLKVKATVNKNKVVKKEIKKVKPVVKAHVKTVGGLNVDCYGISGKVLNKVNLPKEIFGAKVNDRLMAQAVRVYLANKRKGTASTKTRGEVDLTTKKAWKQKGTGRARHGAKSAPIWVGGGVAFGPKPRDFSLKITKKMKKAALFSALTMKLKDAEIKFIEGLSKVEPKTKEMTKIIKNLDLENKNKKILLIIPEFKNKFENVYKAARNIKGVNILSANMLNTYDTLNNKILLFEKNAIETLEKTFLKKEGK